MIRIFTEHQEKLANFLLEKNEIYPFYSYPKLDDLALEWSYYSAKTEENSYSFVQAEILLKDNLTSVHRYEDAVMLKNLYKVFFFLAKELSKNDKKQEINQEFILKTHSTLMRELIYIDFVLGQKLKFLQFFTKEDLKEAFEKSLKNSRKL